MSPARPCLALAGVLFCATPAQAHINLLSPAPRTPGRPDTTLSSGPCGQRENGRREDGVSVFRPGQRIDVVWEVYVQHVSYFRISFDPDGDDSFSARPSMPSDPAADDPTALLPGEGEIILDYIEDPTGDLERVERQVTLPDVECSACTLQVIQFTYGLPLARATYHQCADIVLDAAAGGGGAAEGAPALEGAVDAGAGRGAEPAPASGCALGTRAPGGAGLALLLSAGLALAGRRRLAIAQRAGSDSIHSPSRSR